MRNMIKFIVILSLKLSLPALSMDDENKQEETQDTLGWFASGIYSLSSTLSQQVAEKHRWYDSRFNSETQKSMVGINNNFIEIEKSREIYAEVEKNFPGCDYATTFTAFQKRLIIGIGEARELCSMEPDETKYTEVIKTIDRFLELNSRILPDFINKALAHKREELFEKQKELTDSLGKN